MKNKHFDFIYAKDQDSHTPLHFSCYFNYYELTEMLCMQLKERIEALVSLQGEDSMIIFEKSNSFVNSSFGLFERSSKRDNFFSGKKTSILESPLSKRVLTDENRDSNKIEKEKNHNPLLSEHYSIDNISANMNIFSDNYDYNSNIKLDLFSEKPKSNTKKNNNNRIADDQSKQILREIINKKSKYGYTPLHFAVENGNIGLIKLLIEFGADVKIKNSKNLTILHMALKTNMVETFIFLQETFADNFNINDVDYENQTYLHYACKQGLLLAVNYLLYLKADINALDVHKRSPIFYAVDSGKNYCVYFLHLEIS